MSSVIGVEKVQPAAGGDAASEHFRTDHLLRNIDKHAISAGFVTSTAQVIKFVLNFGAAAVLARLLSPKEFGLVGMVLGVTSILRIFKELGLSTATVQRQEITQQQVSNLFWTNVGVSGALTLVTAAAAPLAAWFYRDPRVTGIMLALSLTFVLTGSTVQHQALLTRQMRFLALSVIDLASMLLGFVTAVWMAWSGYSYWALVGQQLALAATNLGMTWIASRWRPGLPRRNSGVRPMLKFGAHLTLADLVGRVSVNCDSVIIGRFFGAFALGLYGRASVLLTRPLEQLLDPISVVLIPVLSRLQNDNERYRRSFLHAYDTLALITFPFAAMCLALANPIVLVVLGPKWTGVIPLFGAFTAVAITLPLSIVTAWLFSSQARGKDQLHSYTWAGAVTVAAYFAGLHWGLMGVIISLAITSFAIRMPILYYLAGRSGPVSASDLWSAFFAHLPCWAAVYVSTALARMLVIHHGPIVQVLVAAPLGAAAGVPLFMIFRRPRQSTLYTWNAVVRKWMAAA